jgi:lipopolysaccharide export system protein LptA
MIRYLLLMTMALVTLAMAERLTVEAEKFMTDETEGITIFTGNVIAQKGEDDINASKITIHTDADHNPEEIIAEGNVSFQIRTETGDVYTGKSQKAVIKPVEKSYHFFTDVHLVQINQYKEINGDEVFVNTLKGTAKAKGAAKRPVIMVFDIADKNETK